MNGVRFYYLELFFDKDNRVSELDSQFKKECYDLKTKTVKANGQNLDDIKKEIKKSHPTLRYIHLVDTSEEI